MTIIENNVNSFAFLKLLYLQVNKNVFTFANLFIFSVHQEKSLIHMLFSYCNVNWSLYLEDRSKMNFSLRGKNVPDLSVLRL